MCQALAGMSFCSSGVCRRIFFYRQLERVNSFPETTEFAKFEEFGNAVALG
jgi:hypothetical protein